MRKVKIAQIGTSETTHASQVYKSLLEQNDIFDVIGFADVDKHTVSRNKIFETGKEYRVEDILKMDGIDAVAVECDEVLQTQYASVCIERGLPIHLEKPGSEPQDDFALMLKNAEKKSIPVHMGYMYRYNPAVQYVLGAIHAGKLGEIYCVEAHMDCIHTAEMRKWLRNFKGGMMFYLGCHLVDLIYQIQGEPQEIIPMNMGVDPENIGSNDFGMATFRYKNGMSFAKTCAVEAGGYLRRQLVVCGTKGTIELKPLERPSVGELLTTDMNECYLDEKGYMAWGKTGTFTTFKPYNRYDAMMRSFAEIVQGEKKNPWGYDYELRLHALLRKACGLDNGERK